MSAMHRSIGPLMHGVLDYLTVVLLAMGPSIAGFRGRQATICFVLAAIHLVMTVFTRFPLGISKHIRLPIHGAIEFVVGALMIFLPWIASFSRGVLSRNFFMAIGALILVIWFLTDYRNVRAAGRATTPKPAAP